MNKMAIAAAGLVLFTSGSAFAASVDWSVPYVSGGVGVDERQALRQEATNDNLELSFALRNRDYLGGANVLIKDSKGNKIVEAVSDGPLFFTRLPQGSYTVEATAEETTLAQVVHVPSKGQARIFFAWPSKESADERIASN
jgi:hypothetical protein